MVPQPYVLGSPFLCFRGFVYRLRLHRNVRIDRALPNKALQLTFNSAFRPTRGSVWHSTWAFRSGHGGAVARSGAPDLLDGLL